MLGAPIILTAILDVPSTGMGFRNYSNLLEKSTQTSAASCESFGSVCTALATVLSVIFSFCLTSAVVIVVGVGGMGVVAPSQQAILFEREEQRTTLQTEDVSRKGSLILGEVVEQAQGHGEGCRTGVKVLSEKN